jgi:aspartyl-tRNA(Asn)/glutamyl-tRNA(Gln) amidotransferase subunit A
MINEAILFSSVRAQGEAIRAHKLSPVELTRAYLNRLEKIGPKLGAVVTVTRDLAISQARSAEKEISAGHYRGPLHGIPYGAKDAFSAKGIRTTWGTAPYRDRVFDYDATAVKRLADAGAVLLGKLAMVELVGGLGYNGPDASFTGPGRTPWNPAHWSGGSSSGPGAATSAGLVSFSIAGETGGSILGPSTNCGLAGLRPTYGRVSRYGSASLCWSLDKVGAMCRSADDCGLVLAAIAGHDPADEATSRRKFVYTQPQHAARRYKIGVVKGTYERAQPEIRANFEKSVGVLAKFADVTHDVEFPDFPYTAILWTILGAEGSAAFRDLIDSGKMREMQNEGDRIGGYVGNAISAVDYLQAMRVRKLGRLALDNLLKKYDALIAPSSGDFPPLANQPFARRITSAPAQIHTGHRPEAALVPAGNVAGLPGLTIPNGFGSNSLPTGIQFLGSAWSEATLIEIAAAYQHSTDWHTRRPALENF